MSGTVRFEVFQRAQPNWRFATGFMFVLPHDRPRPGQQNWRFCNKCNVMFFDGRPDKGKCNRDGRGHQAQGFKLVLDHFPA